MRCILADLSELSKDTKKSPASQLESEMITAGEGGYFAQRNCLNRRFPQIKRITQMSQIFSAKSFNLRKSVIQTIKVKKIA